MGDDPDTCWRHEGVALTPGRPHLKRMRQFTMRWLVAVCLWFVVSEGDVAALGVGMAAALFAAAASLALAPGSPLGLSLPGLLRFIGFFAFQSVRGGIDVASRAMHPSLPIDPGMVAYPLRIEPIAVRVMFANTVSLLPGTLSAHLDRDYLMVHVLDHNPAALEEVEVVERRVAEVFGLTLGPPAERVA